MLDMVHKCTDNRAFNNEREAEMTSAQINRAFLAASDAKTKSAVLESIAKHYGISQDSAFDEVIGEGAEHLLDYLTEPTRSATRVLMQRHRFAA